MVDAAFEEGWAAHAAGHGRGGNPYQPDRPDDRLADMLAAAWRLGWLRAELAREVWRHHEALHHWRGAAGPPR